MGENRLDEVPVVPSKDRSSKPLLAVMFLSQPGTGGVPGAGGVPRAGGAILALLVLGLAPVTARGRRGAQG